MENKKIAVTLVVLIAAAGLIFLAAQEWPSDAVPSKAVPQKEKITVAYLPVMQSLPLFVAQERGMFAEEGLDVELVRIESPNQIIDALMSGKVDAAAPSAAAGISAIAEAKNPGSLKIYALICGDLEHLNDELLVAKSSSIEKIAGLRGKKIGIIPGVQFSTMAKKIMLENGVSPSEITLVELPVPNQLPALASGSVDAVLTLEPLSTLGSRKNISRLLVANPMVKFVSDPWCGAAGVVTAKFIAERPQDAKAFARVMARAMNVTESDPSARSYLVSYLALPQSVADDVPMPLMFAQEQVAPGVEQAYQRFADTFVELNVTQDRPNVSRLLDWKAK